MTTRGVSEMRTPADRRADCRGVWTYEHNGLNRHEPSQEGPPMLW